MTISNCLAAKHNPKNACTDKCKWPNACNQSLTVVETSTIEVPAAQEEVKPKRGRKPKGQ